MGTRYCGDIGFWLGIEIELTSSYDSFFQHHNDVIAITYRNVKLHVIVIPIFNVVLISDKDENAINNGKQFILFHFKSSCLEVLWEKKVFIEISQNSQENTCGRVSLLVKLQASSLQLYFTKKETLTQVIFCEFCEIFKNTSGGCFCH